MFWRFLNIISFSCWDYVWWSHPSGGETGISRVRRDGLGIPYIEMFHNDIYYIEFLNEEFRNEWSIVWLTCNPLKYLNFEKNLSPNQKERLLKGIYPWLEWTRKGNQQ